MHVRDVVLPVEGETVPGRIWSPAGPGGGRAVLVGHGRGGSRDAAHTDAVARRIVHRVGALVVALDAPGHGARRAADAAPDAIPPKPDPHRTAREWTACIDTLAGDGVLDPDRIGYWGLSMGTGTGIALLATPAPVRCAALGLMHTRYYPGIVEDAARIRCPVLFSVQWDDERVPRDEAFALFDAIGSPDKRLHAHPGGHGEVPEEELRDAEAFLDAHL